MGDIMVVITICRPENHGLSFGDTFIDIDIIDM